MIIMRNQYNVIIVRKQFRVIMIRKQCNVIIVRKQYNIIILSFVCLVGILTSSSSTRLYRGEKPIECNYIQKAI